MSTSFTRQTSLVPRESNRRMKVVVRVLFQIGDELVLEQIEVPHGETTMSVLRARGYRFDSYDDIEIEPVGRITY